jgi:hypothetical protein
LLCAATTLLVLLPWLLLSLWQVGTIQQDSGAMKALWAADLFPTVASRLTNLRDTLDFFLRGSLRLMWYSLPWPLVAIAILALGAAFIAVQWQRPRGRAAITLRALVIPASVIVVIYGLTMIDRQIWWLGLPWLAMFLTAMIGTVWLCRAIPAVRRRQPLIRGAMVAASLLSFIALARAPLAPYLSQADVLRNQTAIEQLIPADQRIGCFNAGLSLYFGTGRVVALDGLVSHAARGYWVEHRVDDYIRDANVRFIADDAMTLSRAQRFSRGPLPLEVRRTFPLRDWPTGERVLWAVTPKVTNDRTNHEPEQVQHQAWPCRLQGSRSALVDIHAPGEGATTGRAREAGADDHRLHVRGGMHVGAELAAAEVAAGVREGIAGADVEQIARVGQRQVAGGMPQRFHK